MAPTRTMQDWTIQRRVVSVFAAVVVLFTAATAIDTRTIYRLSSNSNQSSKALVNTLKLGVLTMQLSSAADMIVVGALQHDVKALDEGSKEAEAKYAELGPTADALMATTTIDANKERVRKLVTAMREWHTLFVKAVEAGRAGDAKGADEAMDASERYSDDIAQAMVKEVTDAELKAVDAANSDAVRTEWTTVAASAVTILGVIALIAFVLRQIGRALSRVATELRGGAAQVASASAEVSTSAQALSQASTEQAASLEETSATMEEMASMTRQSAEHSHSAAELMGEVDARVRDSNGALHEMVTSMTAIEESSQKISRIIKTIDEIAFQTNILALNAAVEAARAGEAGMGFAVVADEVRNLAQRSAQAAKDTAGLIEESMDRAHGGAAKVDHVRTSIVAITESVSRVKGLIDEVSVATQQQTQGIAQVSQSISQMERVTQTTAASAEEGAASSEELSAQAETTLAVVRKLERLVGVADHRPATQTQRASARAKVLPKQGPKQAAAVARDAEALPLADGTYGAF